MVLTHKALFPHYPTAKNIQSLRFIAIKTL